MPPTNSVKVIQKKPFFLKIAKIAKGELENEKPKIQDVIVPCNYLIPSNYNFLHLFIFQTPIFIKKNINITIILFIKNE
jgi:hypothetical protein